MNALFALALSLSFSFAAASTTAEQQEQVDRHFGFHSTPGFPSAPKKAQPGQTASDAMRKTKSKAAEMSQGARSVVAEISGKKLIGGVAKSLDAVSGKTEMRLVKKSSRRKSQAAVKRRAAGKRSHKKKAASRSKRSPKSKSSKGKQRTLSERQAPYLLTSAGFFAAAAAIAAPGAYLLLNDQRYVYLTSTSPRIDMQPFVGVTFAISAVSAVIGTLVLVSTPVRNAE